MLIHLIPFNLNHFYALKQALFSFRIYSMNCQSRRAGVALCIRRQSQEKMDEKGRNCRFRLVRHAAGNVAGSERLAGYRQQNHP
ncbi:hypothetical protein CTB22_15520 [Salmonella enterica subsp. enterica serovar Litchfield]|nr:hypothetical protein [Salmonella enterica]ECS6949320.1 hypothetical protein [Salmonella enterica subsp. enterica serovar Litchfield]EAM4417402.1 hypothetical protein [Salmonella enterica]EBI3740537.1 hypothetical protein [Salmonella enterica]EBJ8051123.1 hypothetical protein [Salmonella enterica]